ncbi:MAG TPA: NAD(P)H-hydrate dehydratase [Oxalicibacterium sp.]|nr:NAD(P)H-hydrate dehydratase [Oxalicibacterium sp.]
MTGKHPLHSVAAIRSIEEAALRTLPPYTLMQRAGKAAAAFALELLADADGMPPVLVLAGPGNNGGDALEAASLLAHARCEVTVLMTGDVAQLPADAHQAYLRAAASHIVFLEPGQYDAIARTDWALIVDGLFGIGLARPLSGHWRQLVETLNVLPASILSLDVPSGLDADTGTVVGGAEGIAVRATHTLTFIGDKPGLHTCDGRDHAGAVSVACLDIAQAFFTAASSSMALNGVAAFAPALRRRPHNSHKGSYGDVVVLGGAAGMSGAAILSARTAAKCGAGRIFVASIADTPAYDSQQPELMCLAATGIDFSGRTTVAGPGMGTSREAHDLLAQALATQAPLVLDADALNLISEEPALRHRLQSRRAPALLTPHPLEAARLLGTTTEQVQANRIDTARTLATTLHAVVVLKGSGSVITSPDGRIAINPTGNPALATAGSGDVLSGVCGALLAQQWPIWEAALAAVWLHGAAADELVRRGIGPIGVVASELIPEIRALLNRLIAEHALSPN